MVNPLYSQFVSDGLFRSELNSFLKQELAEDGYSGVEVRVTPTRTEIIILATRTQNVLGEKGRRIRELTAVVQKRFNFPEGTVEVRYKLTLHCTIRHPWGMAFWLLYRGGCCRGFFLGVTLNWRPGLLAVYHR